MNKPVSPKRSVNGILLLDKATGFSSNSALQKVKRLFRAKKAGHTGSLDPLASGMLPICFGEATKFSQFLLESDKTYRVAAFLGIRTTTSDKEGEVVEERPVPDLTLEKIDRVFDAFRGDIEQVPSMFSALKYQGQPLYKLARQGITVDRPSRPITVYDLKVTDYKNNVVEFDLKCSKGTYVRTIVDDFGEALGCGAHVIALRRLLVGPYPAAGMVTMEQLESERDNVMALDQHLLPVSTSVAEYPEVQLTESMAFYVRQGQAVMMPNVPDEGLVRISTKAGRFLGVGEIIEGSRLAPRRLIQS
ncbi:MAG: tRNA pseudouridine(55) synthase TruB [Coxiellaceae bacterium]|nr:tRNA pseudouridine(55) synthase TruB [Coxiellaceae bacterium]